MYMTNVSTTQRKRFQRARRVRQGIQGSADRPRLSVFRSHRHLAAQLIDDVSGRTLAQASDIEFAAKKKKTKNPSPRERAAWVGAEIAARAKALGIKRATFDRGRYHYHGLVVLLADAARKGGLAF